MPETRITLTQAKASLDLLIKKSRAHVYKPIGIAETLWHNRVDGSVDLSEPSQYRRRSYDWCGQVCHVLYGRRPVLNSRYWDQLFDAAVLPPYILAVLGEHNRQNDGLVETYVYANVLDKVAGILGIVNAVQSCNPRAFDLVAFLRRFEQDHRFRRSVDKAYEIVVYALFNTITRHLDATVTLSVTPKGDILKDFCEFARLVLGVDEAHPEVRQPARLYRVGTANAADAGLDMWANFGPAVQVKHLSLQPSHFGNICDSVQADQIVIVCKNVEARSIEAVLSQVGFRNRIRGVITELELATWYGLACGEKYQGSVGRDLLRAIVDEMALEFPLTQAQTVNAFMRDRGYDVSRLTGTWAVRNEATEDDEE